MKATTKGLTGVQLIESEWENDIKFILFFAILRQVRTLL